MDARVLIAAVEEALRAAAIRYYGDGEELHSRFNDRKGVFEVYVRKTVAERVADPAAEISIDVARQANPEAQPGEVIEILKDTDAIGRIAAQTAKQVISSKMRDVETESIYLEYSGKVGEVLHGTVERFEGGDIIIDLGRADGCLPRKEQNPSEHYEIGDPLRAILAKTLKGGRGVQIILSRADPTLLIRLLESEVPEIRDRMVMIKAVVREPGERAKVAVSSKERSIDPVGACVGMKGTRIQSIIRELRGERIDVIEWSSDPVAFVTSALNPAKVRRARVVDDVQKIVEVLVDEKQLSLAIGKKGQNVRLASRLTGWHIDIKCEGTRQGAPLTGLFEQDGPPAEGPADGCEPVAQPPDEPKS